MEEGPRMGFRLVGAGIRTHDGDDVGVCILYRSLYMHVADTCGISYSTTPYSAL